MLLDAPPSSTLIERAWVLLTYFIDQGDEMHLPMYEQFERELADIEEGKYKRQGYGGCRCYKDSLELLYFNSSGGPSVFGL